MEERQASCLLHDNSGKLGIPVLLAGGVKTIDQAEELLAEGVADMIGGEGKVRIA